MKEDLQNKLLKKHPRILSRVDCLEVSDGWYNLIDTLCETVQHCLDWHNGEGGFEYRTKYFKEVHVPIPQVEAIQIKQKFGGLRFYFEGGDDQVVGMVTMAEQFSNQVCEHCGDLGTQAEGYWILTLCSSCQQNRESEGGRTT